MVGHARRDPEYDAITYFDDTLSAHSNAQPPAPRTRSSVRNERARAFPTRAAAIWSGQSEESGGQQHGQGGGVGIELRINADLADQLRHRALDIGLHPGRAMVE